MQKSTVDSQPGNSSVAEGASQVLSREGADQLAAFLKAIADPTRLQLISLIEASVNLEACVCNLTEPLGLTQPTVSHHLRILTDAGIIRREKRGTWAWYSIEDETWDRLAPVMRGIIVAH